MESLEDLYFPSKWALLPANEVVEKHIEFVSKGNIFINTTFLSDLRNISELFTYHF